LEPTTGSAGNGHGSMPLPSAKGKRGRGYVNSVNSRKGQTLSKNPKKGGTKSHFTKARAVNARKGRGKNNSYQKEGEVVSRRTLYKAEKASIQSWKDEIDSEGEKRRCLKKGMVATVHSPISRAGAATPSLNQEGGGRHDSGLAIKPCS